VVVDGHKKPADPGRRACARGSLEGFSQGRSGCVLWGDLDGETGFYRGNYAEKGRLKLSMESAPIDLRWLTIRPCIKMHNIRCSISRKGNCWDNAVAESFFQVIVVCPEWHLLKLKPPSSRRRPGSSCRCQWLRSLDSGLRRNDDKVRPDLCFA
jgi:hypothetical protein